MSDAEFFDTMENLQFSGHAVKWFVHRKGHFSKRDGFNSRAIAAQIAAERGMTMTPDFA